MIAILDLLGAATARMLGLVALLPAATLTHSWIGYRPGSDPLPQLVVAVVMILVLTGVGIVLLSPAGTVRFLRRRPSTGGRAAFAVFSIFLLALVLNYAIGALPRIDPRAEALTRPFAALCIGLGLLYVALFLMPGSYARRLAVRHDPQGAVARETVERAALSWRDIVANFTGAITARLIGVFAALHPLALTLLYLRDAPIDPLSWLAAPLTAVVAIIFLVPAATRYIFEPLHSRIARFAFGFAALLAVATALTFSGVTLAYLAPEPKHEFYLDGLTGLFQIPMILFVVMFLYPAYYVQRLPKRAALRQLGREQTAQAAQADAAPQHEAAAHGPGYASGSDWRNLPRVGEQRPPAEPPRLRQPPPRRRPLPRRPFVIAAINHLSMVPVIALGGLALYGWMSAQFVPSSEIAALAAELHIPLLLSTGVLVLVAAITADDRHPRVIRSMPLRCTLGVAAFVGLMALGSRPLFLHGLPGLHSHFVEAPASEITLEVTEIVDGQVRRRCDYSVMARGDDYAGPDGVKICEVGRDLWGTLRPGDRITLKGYRTRYGFRYDRVLR